MLRRVAQGWSEVTNAEPRQGALHAVHKPRAFLDQALALPIRPLGVLFGNRWHARHAAMAPFATQPPQEPALQQLGVTFHGVSPKHLPRYAREWNYRFNRRRRIADLTDFLLRRAATRPTITYRQLVDGA